MSNIEVDTSQRMPDLGTGQFSVLTNISIYNFNFVLPVCLCERVRKYVHDLLFIKIQNNRNKIIVNK